MADRSALTRVLASRWFDPALALCVICASLAELVLRSDLTDSPRAPIAVLLVGSSLAFRRSHPLAVAGVLGAVLLATPNYDDHFLPAAAAAAGSIVSYSLGAHATRRSGVVAVLLLAAAMQIGMGFSEFPNFEVLFQTLGPWWVGVQVRRRRTLVAELREHTAQLREEQDAFARLSVRRERARIARELHDVVGHHLAVIVVQAGAGRMEPPAQGGRGVERFAGIRESAGHALEEMAHLVDLLDADRDDRSGVLGRLRVLIDEAAAGGIRVGFTPLAPDVRLDREVEDVAYRVVQEGMTNAIKHAPGADLSVRLAAYGEALEIEISNGAGAAASGLATAGSGLGLAGMRDRVEALGGSMDAGASPEGGWRLKARLPLTMRETAALV